MLPVLKAEEAMQAAMTAAVGSGSLKDARSVVAEWERVAERTPSRNSGFTPSSETDYRAALASLGIEFIEEDEGAD